MAKHKKRQTVHKPQKKSKPTARDWSDILIRALLDLLIGTLLILIAKIMDLVGRCGGASPLHLHCTIKLRHCQV